MPLLPCAPRLKESQVAVRVKTLPLTKMGSSSFMRRTSAQAGRLSRGRRNSTVPNRGMVSACAGRAPKRPARKTAKQTMVHAIRCGRMTGDRREDRAGGDTGGKRTGNMKNRRKADVWGPGDELLYCVGAALVEIRKAKYRCRNSSVLERVWKLIYQ